LCASWSPIFGSVRFIFICNPENWFSINKIWRGVFRYLGGEI
jgi:hypothetical protein